MPTTDTTSVISSHNADAGEGHDSADHRADGADTSAEHKDQPGDDDGRDGQVDPECLTRGLDLIAQPQQRPDDRRYNHPDEEDQLAQ
jgi:hypothetical protein